MMRKLFIPLLLLAFFQPACIWRLWTKDKPIELRSFDVYGTVRSVTQDGLVIETKKGEQTFVLGPSSIKGSDFKVGAYVHVYYKKLGGVDVVTMAVEKIK